MSSDLFAAFAPQSTSGTSAPPLHAGLTASSTPQSASQPSQPFSFFDDLGTVGTGTSSNQGQAALETPKADSVWSSLDSSRPNDVTIVSEDADDWGDFEGAPEPQPAASVAAGLDPPAAFRITEREKPLESPTEQEAHVVTAISKQAVRNPAFYGPPPVALFGPGSQHGTRAQPTDIFTQNSSSKHGFGVLFDATELEAGEDDFGDFETPVLPQSRGSADERSKPSSSSASQVTSIPILGLPTATFRPTSQPPLAVQETQSWDEFAEWDENSPQVANDTSDTTGTPILTLPSMLPSSDPSLSDHEPPPTNVPPPGVLLSLFPLLFSEAQTQLFKPMAAQTFQMKNRILSDHTVVGFLQGYLAIATVAARIIAGRKLRWKRDVHLAQGMRLGPASSRATSGMKLTGIDKSEMNKEEREVLDVVRAWKDQVGRLRSAVAAANAIKPGCLGPVPDIQEVMLVKLLSEAEGGVPAPKQCALCGLKREERVTKVDIAVEDSFGEWWVEQTRMHRGCKNFWAKHKDTLRQR